MCDAVVVGVVVEGVVEVVVEVKVFAATAAAVAETSSSEALGVAGGVMCAACCCCCCWLWRPAPVNRPAWPLCSWHCMSAAATSVEGGTVAPFPPRPEVGLVVVVMVLLLLLPPPPPPRLPGLCKASGATWKLTRRGCSLNIAGVASARPRRSWGRTQSALRCLFRARPSLLDDGKGCCCCCCCEMPGCFCECVLLLSSV
jgi:hypothetical protein